MISSVVSTLSHAIKGLGRFEHHMVRQFKLFRQYHPEKSIAQALGGNSVRAGAPMSVKQFAPVMFNSLPKAQQVALKRTGIAAAGTAVGARLAGIGNKPRA